MYIGLECIVLSLFLSVVGMLRGLSLGCIVYGDEDLGLNFGFVIY